MPKTRLKLYRGRKPRPEAAHEGKVLRGFAMRRAREAIRKAA